MNLKSIFFLTLVLFSPVFATYTFAADNNNEKDTILEITDRYREVKLGVTKTSVYMIVDEKIRSLVNLELQSQYEKDLRDFDDSEGNFIPGVHSFLSSNIIEIPFSDINNLDFSNGALRFNYSSNVSIQLEDVTSLNGNKALDNFYIEDLEQFYIAAVNRS